MAEVVEQFEAIGAPVSPHMTYEMMLNDPHYKAREVFIEGYDPVTDSMVKQVNLIPRFKKHPGQIVRGGAAYDEDTVDVLLEHGYTQEEIDGLYERGVLKKGDK